LRSHLTLGTKLGTKIPSQLPFHADFNCTWSGPFFLFHKLQYGSIPSQRMAQDIDTILSRGLGVMWWLYKKGISWKYHV